ncbi:ATP-dependent protease [Alphaproteobacteria bacterium]|nr:ATP-dependent protease [Alphaproteobacteria bacterium]GHS99645.1 ATP-dependent protease [Alphaproteobacteria bacterium]
MLIYPGSLPRVLPLIPLSRGILVPRSELHIPITDFAQLSSFIESIKGDSYVGVIQFRRENASEMMEDPLFGCGCTGRVLDIQENDENQLVFSLQGVCRFEIEQELPSEKNIRRALVSYEKFRADVVQEADFAFDRERLMFVLKPYFKKIHIHPDWQELSKTSNERLLTLLMMMCPFEASEKQALLETVGYEAQSKLVTSLVEMDAFQPEHQTAVFH